MAERERGAAGGPVEGGQPSHTTLREFLTEQYDELKLQLTRRLGSQAWAEEALHDTYLRLNGTEALGRVSNPGAYLFRAAIHNALNRRRAEVRRLSAVDIETLLHIADDAPGAQRIVEGRSDLALLSAAIAALPPRQRSILIAARLEGLSRQQIADQFGISVSTVEKELKRAQEHCAISFRRKKVRR